MTDPHTHTQSERAAHEHEHEHVAELLHTVDVRAPERLHEQVQTMVAGKRRGRASASRSRRVDDSQRSRRHPNRALIGRRLKPTLAAVAVAALAGAAIALLTGGGATQQSLNLSEASALTLRTATMSAPSESQTHAAQLDIAVDGVAFPYWEEHFGWRSTGSRTDTVGGRKVTTVFYSGARGSKIGYAIVSGTPAPSTSGGTISWRGGVPYRLLSEHGAPVVTWERDGRLCVLSGRGVSGATLLGLAGWSDDGGPLPS